jgi:hypothetical protein
MTEFLMSGSEYFPGWVSILFSAGLALGIVHHVPCLISGHANRWFHGAHAAMALSMIYMYLSMSYDWNWLPASWQMWFFVATSVAILAYLSIKIAFKQPINLLWIPLLIQQASMIYMWYPMMRWNSILIFVLVSWFAIETFGWIANLLPDDVRRAEGRGFLRYELVAKPSTTARTEQRVTVAGGAVGGVSEERGRGVAESAESAVDCHVGADLVTSTWKDRTLMAIMALSMGYMFYGMELMRWVPLGTM